MPQSIALDSTHNTNAEPDAPDCEVEIEHEPAVDTDKPEKFIPLTRFALMQRLGDAKNWEPDEYQSVPHLMNCLNMWRHQEYCTRLSRLTEAYMPFSPDRDTKRILQYTDTEHATFQMTFMKNIEDLLIQGNYQKVTEDSLNDYFSAKSPYGLNLKVDLSEFEEVLVYCRGADIWRKKYRSWKKLYLREDYLEVPIFQRLFLLIKLKPEDIRIKEIMTEQEVSEAKAKRIFKKVRRNLPDEASPDHIYLKLFKKIPQSDLEMLFPNTQVDFKLLDKIKLGVTAGGGTIAGIAGTATKLLAAIAAANIFAVIGAFIGIIALISRQVMKFFNQRTQYMMVLAQNLYFHNLANNRGVLTLMCDRAQEEDVKEEILLYAYLTQYDVPSDALEQAKMAIEEYLRNEFGVVVDYDIEDALSRLSRDGLVVSENGRLRSLRPPHALARLHELWGSCIEERPAA